MSKVARKQPWASFGQYQKCHEPSIPVVCEVQTNENGAQSIFDPHGLLVEGFLYISKYPYVNLLLLTSGRIRVCTLP